ncbi:MAG: hypothetical protein O3A19_00220 [Planctomycetota bacterium]|jgi:hypothetical protein|nr:hypothetical protein [Planctomycetota bacterium]MDA1024826.1 hypothetical protein [Planctomycetota bacterium]
MKNLDFMTADARFQKVMLGLGVVALALGVFWTVNPSSTLATVEGSFDRTSDPVDLGTLSGQTLSIRVISGPFGPGYEVLDENGTLVGRFESEYQLIAAFSVPAPSQQLADVPTIDDWD